MKILLLIATLLLTTCAGTLGAPTWQDMEEGTLVADWGVPKFGIITDADLRVEMIVPSSGADTAGIRVNDTLIELVPADGAKVASLEPIPFTDEKAIAQRIAEAMFLRQKRSWLFGPINYRPVSGPFHIKVERSGQIVELLIYAQDPPPSSSRSGTATPTPTILPMASRYF